jgi:hypothetical protein
MSDKQGRKIFGLQNALGVIKEETLKCLVLKV